MDEIKIKVILLIIIISSLMIGCTSSVSKEKQCSSDLDCVADICCHPTDVINKEFRPDCKNVLCSAVCEPNTLDCGQAVPKCIEGACMVVTTQN